MAVKDFSSRKRVNTEHSPPGASSPKKICDEFALSVFKEKLKNKQCFEALENFIALSQRRNTAVDPASEILEGGCQLEDVVACLDFCKSEDYSEACTVFSAIHILLLHVLRNPGIDRQNAILVCHQILSKHLNIIHRLLRYKGAYQKKKIVLQLLTVIVTFNAGLAREVLSYVSLDVDMVCELVEMVKPDDPQSVRVCFIQFLMAFLVDGDPCVIKFLLLNKCSMLTSIFRYLQYDSHPLVIFTLTTLHTKLVKCREIAKIQKVHVFTIEVMEQLVKLYNWKGPAAFSTKRNKTAQVALHEVKEVEQQAVAEAVHTLLLSLCTSHDCGIISSNHSLGTSAYEKNSLVHSALKELKQPWENDFQADLFIQVIKICPEFSKLAYKKVESVLEPRPSSSWLKAIEFVTKIIAALNLNGLSSLESNAASSVSKSLAAPREVLKRVGRGLLHPHPKVFQKTAEFLQSVLHLVHKTRKFLPESKVEEFQHHLWKVLPNCAILQQAWANAEMPASSEIPLVNEELNPSSVEMLVMLVDYMLLCQKECSLLLDFDAAQGKFVPTITKCLELDIDTDNNVLELQMKVLQFVLSLDVIVLVPGKDNFRNAINILFLASCKNDELAQRARSTLGNLLVKYQVLEPTAADDTSELGVWFQNFRIVKPREKVEIFSFLHDSIVNAAKNPEMYIEKVFKAEEATFALEGINRKKFVIHKDVANEVFSKLLGKSKPEKHIQYLDEYSNFRNFNGRRSQKVRELNIPVQTVELSVLTMSVLDCIEGKKSENASVEKYLSRIMVHLLYMQTEILPYVYVVRNLTFIPPSVRQYLNSWVTEQPIALTEPFGPYSREAMLSIAFLHPEKDLPELEDSQDPISILLLLRLTSFHVAQLAEKRLLNENICASVLQAFRSLKNALVITTSEMDSYTKHKYLVAFFNSVLRHQVLLHYFAPVSQKHTDKLVTNLLLDFLENICDFQQSSSCKDSSILLKEKLLRIVLNHLETSENTPSENKALIRAVKLLPLTELETLNLISKLREMMLKEPWTELLCYLLRKVHLLPCNLVNALGLDLMKQLQKSNDHNSTVWKVIKSFALYLEKHPFYVKNVPLDLFKHLVCKRGLKLASLILRHEKKAIKELVEMTKENNSLSFDVLAELFTVATHHDDFPSSLLMILYEMYGKKIRKGMKVPFSAPFSIVLHPDTVCQLIVECFDADRIHALCKSLSTNWKNIGLCTVFHMSVIRGLYIREGWKEQPINFVQLLIHQVKEMLCTSAPASLVIQACSLLRTHLNNDKIKWQDHSFLLEDCEEIPALFLQRGLSDYNLTPILFPLFALLLFRAKAVDMADKAFNLILSHSRFLDIVLPQDHSGTKLAVLQLLLTSGMVAPHAMKSVQIPIWLGAYGASLSHCDQTILKILHYLSSRKDINLNAYRPFLWGEAAINHYSIRKRAGLSLWRIPSATVVLELLEQEKIETTITHFPIEQNLLCEDSNSKLTSVDFVSSFVENLKPCQPDVYDPSFMMPVLSHIMAPESDVSSRKFILQGGLALTLSALSSKCECMRSAALTVLSRFYNHLNPYRFKSKVIEQFVESIRCGIQEFSSYSSKHAMKRNTNGSSSITQLQKIRRIPCISSTFIARASLILTNPLAKLYLPLNRFIQAKPSLNFNTLPEFMELLRHASINFRTHQLWLLETAGNGMRTKEDVTIAYKHYVFKILLVFFSSSLADAKVKVHILRILEATLKIPTGVMCLKNQGIIPWLYGVVSDLEEEENCDLIVSLIRVVTFFINDVPGLPKKMTPFLSKLPVLEYSDAHCVLTVAQMSTQYLSKEHLIELLCACLELVDLKTVEECSSQLNLKADIIRNLHQDKIVKQVSSIENGITKPEDIVLVKGKISNLLKIIFCKWRPVSDSS